VKAIKFEVSEKELAFLPAMSIDPELYSVVHVPETGNYMVHVTSNFGVEWLIRWFIGRERQRK